VITGTLCPQCGKPVMPFGRFCREAEPLKVSSCSNCGVKLMRRRSVWLLLAVGTLVAVLVVGFGIPIAFARWGAVVAALFVGIVAVVFVFGLKFCGWLFVGWSPTASTGDNSS